MAFDLSALQQWKEERGSKEDIILRPLAVDPSVDYMEVFADVTGQRVLKPILNTSGDSTPGAYCSTTNSENMSITQFELSASVYQYRQNFCLQELQRYFTKNWLTGKKPTTIEVLDSIAMEIKRKTANRNKAYVWLNDTAIAAYPSAFNAFDGLLKKIDAGVPVSQVHTVASGKTLGTTNSPTTEKVTEVIDKLLYQLLPANAFFDRPVVFVGLDVFRIIENTIKNDNLFHYTNEGLSVNPYVMRYPGTTALIVGTSGLNSDNVTGQVLAHRQRIVATFVGNLALSLSFENENDFVIDYSAYHKELFFDANFWLGGGVKFADLVATSKLS